MQEAGAADLCRSPARSSQLHLLRDLPLWGPGPQQPVPLHSALPASTARLPPAYGLVFSRPCKEGRPRQQRHPGLRAPISAHTCKRCTAAHRSTSLEPPRVHPGGAHQHRVRLDPTQGRCFFQHLGGSNCLCITWKPWGLLKSESTLFFFRPWDGAGVQRVRTQLWDQVTCLLS